MQALASITADQGSRPELTEERFRMKLQELIDAHPRDLGRVDDGRESIYAGRGE
jgi:hypothetical protein